MTQAITIRRSTEADESALIRLAHLDDRRVPRGVSYLGYVDGELRAAVPIDPRSEPVADPFHLTREVVNMLELRASQERLAA